MQFVNLLISAILQVLLFSSIPFICWLIFARKKSSFFAWVGLKKLEVKNTTSYLFIFFATIILLSTSLMIVPLFLETSMLAQDQFAGQGWSAFIPALIYAFLQTSFSEELFFRGFITKRLINQFGFQTGNVIQGLIFGVLHGLMFMTITGIFGIVIVTLITAVTGYLMGFINEKLSNGSILSSWFVHGIVNTLACIVAMFNLV